MTTSARRQLFRRSKAGCWNCRSKKKKCDELRPHCTRCIRAGEGCRYPDSGTDSSDPHPSVSGNGYVSPSIPSSASFPTNLSMHAPPLLSRSASSAGFSSPHHSRHGHRHAYQHHPYAPPSGPSHLPLQQREYHLPPQGRHALHQRPSPPPPYANHHPYHNGSHSSSASAPPPLQQFPPPPMSANAAADWDHTSQEHVSQRTRYDDISSTASSNSSNAALQDARARQQPFDAHHRIPSNHSQTSSKGKGRDTLPPISPHQSYSVPMAASASLPPLMSSSAQRPAGSPVASIRSSNTSPTDHASPVFPTSHRPSSGTTATAAETPAHESRLASSTAYPSSRSLTGTSHRPADNNPHQTAPRSPPIRNPRADEGAAQPRKKLVLDYNSTEPDPEDLLNDLHSHSMTIVTQQTKGAEAYFRLLTGIARMQQGQAMAHALAAMIATSRAKLYDHHRKNDTLGPASTSLSRELSVAAAPRPGSSAGSDGHSAQLLELADRHHLAAIKALQTQQQPSRRRRFSVIETNSSKAGDELPPGSNAAVMMLLILACGSAGKSLMLPSYFNQCEQFLADAVQDVSSRRMFPSVTGDPIVGNAEDPPIQPPEELDNYCLLLFIATVVGLYEYYLAQYTAIADWDYNPARLRRLVPFNCSASDLAIFDSTRAGVSETTSSVSIVTLELVIETLDTMRKFKRAEAAAYGNRNSSRSEAEDGVAALDSLALKEELGLLIRDLEAGAFWKGPIRCLSNAEQMLVIEFVEGAISADTLAEKAEDETRTGKAGSRIPPPASAEDLTCRAMTKAFGSGELVHAPKPGEPKQVNRLRLANHLYRNALLVDLYVNVFNRAPSSLAVRELVSRSISLLGAVPQKLEQGLEWPVIVLGSYAQDEPERSKVRSYLKRSQWKGTEGYMTAARIIERVWAEDAPSWRESAIYFGSPYLS